MKILVSDKDGNLALCEVQMVHLTTVNNKKAVVLLMDDDELYCRDPELLREYRNVLQKIFNLGIDHCDLSQYKFVRYQDAGFHLVE